MGQMFKFVTSPAWLLLVVLAIQPANAQKRYPAIEDAWDGTDYRAVIQRVEKDGLELPTLANSETKPVFERMVSADNIPLHMGLNPKLSITIRFQRLDSALAPLHKLAVLYSNEIKKGKPYGAELARLMVYESKVSGALLELSEPYLLTLASDKRYQLHVEVHNQMKNDARQLYTGLVQGVTETNVYSKPDILKMIGGAIDGLPAYQPILTDQGRQELVQKLTQQISKTTDQELKTAMTELRDAIQHRRVRT